MHRIHLAPMVHGSELAMRMLVRKHGVLTCYGPMLRAAEVIRAHEVWKVQKNDLTKNELSNLGEDAYLCITDTCSEDRPLVVQICGNCPDELGAATKALIEIYENRNNPLDGVDLNLGCPQGCAEKGSFGAFLAEKDPNLAVRCIQGMRHAIDQSTTAEGNAKPRLSCKIRLFDDNASTISFAKKLRDVGCDLLAVHCRRRTDKHNGVPDFALGASIVQALDIPVVINGGVRTVADADRVIQETGAHAVMAARGFLENPRIVQLGLGENRSLAATCDTNDPAFLAAEYLDFAEKYPPPSPLYIRKHLRWIFRSHIEPKDRRSVDFSDWRPRLWTFLVRPYLETMEQFRKVVLLYVKLNGSPTPPSLAHLPEPSFKSIRNGKKKSASKTSRKLHAM